MSLSPTDKTDIVIALRKVATGLEQGDSKTFDLLEAIGTELLVLALKHALPAAPLAEAVPMVPEAVEAVARREVSAIGDSVQRFLSHQVTERDILNERLMRQFDPSMAWNEAINRAIDAKKAAKQEVEEVIIAYDALAVIVNPSNPVSQLTRQQLEAIFRGKITNWKQLGGPDMKIIVYSRETSSGTYEFFKESALKNKNYMSSSLSMPATGAVIQSVSQTKGAIGYVGLAYLSPRVKAIAVSYDDGKHYVLPSLENGKKKLYPVVRPLYYYYNVANKEKVTPFIDYILSPQGQNIIKNGGYIPVK